MFDPAGSHCATAGVADLGGTRALGTIYMDVKESLIGAGYADEIDWQSSRRWPCFTESEFLREAAWVVLTCGFRESVIRARWHSISRAFLQWTSSLRIASDARACRRRAMRVFANGRKLDAIVEIASGISESGFAAFAERVAAEGVAALGKLPFMGPATSVHLAKNLGLAAAKPDRHLVRIAAGAGFADTTKLCEAIASVVGDPVSVVDVVLWRYATLHPRRVVEMFSAERRR